LLTNAVKYTPSKGKISISLKKGEGKEIFGEVANKNDLIFIVADSGSGIPLAEQDKIFSKMYRAGNAKQIDPGGNGLGLYLLKKIAERLNGKIWFKSPINKEPNPGTAFCIKIPL